MHGIVQLLLQTKKADLLTKKLTALNPPQYQNIFLCNNHNATGMQLIPLDMLKPVESNRYSMESKRSMLIERGQPLERLGF